MIFRLLLGQGIVLNSKNVLALCNGEWPGQIGVNVSRN